MLFLLLLVAIPYHAISITPRSHSLPCYFYSQTMPVTTARPSAGEATKLQPTSVSENMVYASHGPLGVGHCYYVIIVV